MEEKEEEEEEEEDCSVDPDSSCDSASVSDCGNVD